MPLLTGTRLGPYEVLAPIGAGGMGEVYRARDTRLGRTVAIKVLPAHLANHPELKQRFEREARAVSSLNHPHICTLYDIGHQDGTDFLVMEYLEGETLAKRIERGPLETGELLRYGIEIADALDKAHRQGVVHRDLKPSNIMLIPRGGTGTKLLDFGLAKAKPAEAAGGAGSTISATLTAQGTIVGTFQYMAPEQLEGKEADARSDIFAFGAVLYEMATGKKAFEGKTQASLFGAILHTEPPSIVAAQPMAPPALDRLIKTCLAKDPDERRQSAHDLLLELRWISEGGSKAGVPAPVVAHRKSRERLAWALAALMAVAAVLAYFRDTPRPQLRLAVPPPAGTSLAPTTRTLLAFSPDGTQLAFAARRGGNSQLYLRSLDSFDSRPVPGTEGGDSPFFSPDGQWLGFFADGKIKKVALAGGAPSIICDAPSIAGAAAWASDDTILFSPVFTSGLSRVPASGGKPQPLTRLDPRRGEVGHAWPVILPGGNWFLFSVASGRTEGFSIAAQSLQTGERRTLLDGGVSPRYSPTGHLLFARSGRLMAVRFDPDKLKITGTPVPLGEELFTNPTWGVAQFTFSNRGTLAYIPGGNAFSASTLVWIDRQGHAGPLSESHGTYMQPRLSPEGQRIALTVRDGDDIWVYETARGALNRLTFEPGEDETAVWTPDGKRLAFSSSRVGHEREIIWKPADGSGAEEVLLASDHHLHLNSFSPDGKWLVFSDLDPDTGYDLWMLPMEGERKPRVFLRTPFQEWGARFSPDGRWIAYTSNESGRDEVYVQAFPGPGGKWQVSIEGGSEPVWSPGGRELFFRQANRMMAAAVETGASFSAARPQLLWEGPYVGFEFHQSYDVAADGRFLMLTPAESSSAAEIRVALNWFDELKRRAK